MQSDTYLRAGYKNYTFIQSYSRSRNISKWYVDSVSLPIHILQSDVRDETQAQYNMPQTYTAGTHRHTAKGRRVLPIALLLEEPRLPGPSQSEYYYYSGLPTHPSPIHCQEDLLDSYTKTETKAKAMRWQKNSQVWSPVITNLTHSIHRFTEKCTRFKND